MLRSLEKIAAVSISALCIVSITTGSATASEITVPAAPVSLAAPTTSRIAVLTMNSRGQHRTPTAASTVNMERFFFGTQGKTVATYFAEASDGQVEITGKYYGAFDVDVATNDCSMGLWQTKAEEFIASQGDDPASYRHIVIDSAQSCGWSGLGMLPGRVIAITSLNLGSVVHELGHNLGLLHSSLWNCGATTLPVPPATTCPRIEYGDSNDVMGSGVALRQFSAHNKFRLGWMSPNRVATVSAAGATDIDLTSSEHVAALAPSGATPTQMIMVPLADGSSYAVERRESSGQFDQGSSGVWIRKIPAANNPMRLDTTPGSWPQNDHADGNLAADRTFTDAVNDVSISTMTDNGPTAGIRVCRPKCFPTTFPVPVDPAVSATLVGTTVVVRGTDGNDGVQIQRFGTEYVVRWPGGRKVEVGAGCVWENVYATCKIKGKVTVDVDLGAGNDSVLVDGKFRSVWNGGPGDDTFIDIYAKSADVMRGGPGTDTVDYGWREGAAARNIVATPGTGPDDGKRNEHDDIGADIELVRLPPT